MRKYTFIDNTGISQSLTVKELKIMFKGNLNTVKRIVKVNRQGGTITLKIKKAIKQVQKFAVKVKGKSLFVKKEVSRSVRNFFISFFTYSKNFRNSFTYSKEYALKTLRTLQESNNYEYELIKI